MHEIAIGPGHILQQFRRNEEQSETYMRNVPSKNGMPEIRDRHSLWYIWGVYLAREIRIERQKRSRNRERIFLLRGFLYNARIDLKSASPKTRKAIHEKLIKDITKELDVLEEWL